MFTTSSAAESADQYNFRGLGIVFEELVDKGVSFDEVRF